MKKLLYIFMLLLITGCTQKELSCDYKYEDDNMKVFINVYMSFKNNKPLKLKNTINYATENEELKEQLLEQYTIDDQIDGINFDVLVKGNNIEIIQEIDYTVVVDDLEFEIANKDVSYTSAKESLINSSYVCK